MILETISYNGRTYLYSDRPACIHRNYLNERERKAIRIYSRAAGHPGVCKHEVLLVLQDGCWYDYACPETGLWGQCCVKDGKWHQEPRGSNPVILFYNRKVSN